MKKRKLVLPVLLLAILLTGCSQENEESALTAQTTEITSGTVSNQATEGTDMQRTDNTETNGNVLIAYFSVPETDGVDAVAGSSRVVEDGEVIGNTEFVAQAIQQETGGELFRIETVKEYPGDHDDLVDVGRSELAEEARPELSSQIENLDNYDTIFLGYPIWSGDLPMALYTFLESTDLSGKTIIPFSTHGGSGFSGTLSTLEDLQPNAEILDNSYTVSRTEVPDSREEILEWVDELSL